MKTIFLLLAQQFAHIKQTVVNNISFVGKWQWSWAEAMDFAWETRKEKTWSLDVWLPRIESQKLALHIINGAL